MNSGGQDIAYPKPNGDSDQDTETGSPGGTLAGTSAELSVGVEAGLRLLVTELARTSEANRVVAEALQLSIERLSQIEERLGLYDQALPELLKHSQRDALLRASYERYLPQHLIEELSANPGRVNISAHLRRVTVLFADFRSFTATVSRMHPQDVIRVLNSYLGQMAEIIYDHGGSIDKFLGDGFMALFGSPDPREDDAVRAVRAALDIQKLLSITSVGETEPSGFRLPMGIGINTGEVVVGALGSPNRMDYTVIGDAVNMAA